MPDCYCCGEEASILDEITGHWLCYTCYEDINSRVAEKEEARAREEAEREANSCSRCGAENAYHLDDSGNRLCDTCFLEFVNAKADAKANEARAEVLEQHGLARRSGGCFIATAAYGTPMAIEICTLRRFRDEFMERNNVGRRAIEVYYHVSPHIANRISISQIRRRTVRFILKPFISILQIFGF